MWVRIRDRFRRRKAPAANRPPAELAVGADTAATAPTRQQIIQQEQLWLLSSNFWQNPVGNGWVPKKVLGTGGFGIVGHWKYGGNVTGVRISDLVVKQAAVNERNRHGLSREAAILQRLAETNSPHVVKMYQKLFEEQGRGTFPKYDPVGTVHRIYLEYCPGGDLSQWSSDRRRA